MDKVQTVQDGKATSKDLPLYTTPGGATRSEKASAFHLIPRAGLRRTAKRYALGAEIHGEFNWMLSLDTEANALVWAREAFNHGMEHMLKMANGIEPDDDHLGAIGWAQTQLAYIEEKFNCRWTDLTKSKVATASSTTTCHTTRDWSEQ